MTVQVTLTFANTEEMLAYFSKPQQAVVSEAPAPAPKPEKPKAEKPKAEAKPEPKAEPPVAAPTAQAAAPAPAASSTDYATLQKAVVGIATRGEAQRARVLQIAADMGFKTFKEMPAEMWPTALAEVNKLAEQLDAENEVA